MWAESYFTDEKHYSGERASDGKTHFLRTFETGVNLKIKRSSGF